MVGADGKLHTLLVGNLVEAVLKNLVEMKWFIIASRHFALTSASLYYWERGDTRARVFYFIQLSLCDLFPITGDLEIFLIFFSEM